MGVNLVFVAVTTIISLLAFGNRDLFNKLLFNAYRIKHDHESWRFFTYALVHEGWMHLLVNMYILYSFGGLVEGVLKATFGNIGIFYYALLYIGGVIFSTLYDFGKHKNDPYYSAIGASGATSAILFSAILLYPQGGIMIFPIPFSVPSWVFGILFLIYSAYMGKRGQDNIGHNAHFWGAVFGIVFTIILIPGTVKQFVTHLFGG